MIVSKYTLMFIECTNYIPFLKKCQYFLSHKYKYQNIKIIINLQNL